MVEIIRYNKEKGLKRLDAIQTQDQIWKQCVEQARVLSIGRNKARAMICGLAEKACDIVIGGGGHWQQFKNQYTITKFAAESGIHSKTLLNWLGIYRNVYLNLPKDLQLEKFNWTVGDKVRSHYTKTKSDPTKEELKKFYLKNVNVKKGDKVKDNIAKYCGNLHANLIKLRKKSDMIQAKTVLETMLRELNEKIEQEPK